jgi:hypothetical protein
MTCTIELPPAICRISTAGVASAAGCLTERWVLDSAGAPGGKKALCAGPGLKPGKSAYVLGF